jgi:hypothetical protein
MNFLDSKDRNNLSLALYSLENFGAEITKNGDEIIELAEQYTEFIAD